MMMAYHETDRSEMKLERVPSLTESEDAFLSEAMTFGAEDTTTHVLSSCSPDQGFTSAEMAELLGPSPEDIVEIFGRANGKFQPFNLLKKLESTISIPLSSFVKIDSSEIPLVRTHGENSVEIIAHSRDKIVLLHVMHSNVRTSDTLAFPDTISKLIEIDEKTLLSVTATGISTLRTENEKLEKAMPTWSLHGSNTIEHVSEAVSSLQKLAFVTSQRELMLFDISNLSLSGRVQNCFGSENATELKWNHWRPSELACSTDLGNLHIIDVRYPMSRAHCLNDGGPIACHTFVSETQVLVGCRSGLMQVFDIRRPIIPIVSYRDPLISRPNTISSTLDGRRVAISGDNNITSIWNLDVGNDEDSINIMHTPCAHIASNNAHQNARWIGQDSNLISALSTPSTLSIYNVDNTD